MTSDERDTILAWLDDEDIEYEVYSHERIHTSEEAAQERDHGLDETVKSLLLDVDGDHVLYVLPGDRLVDFDAVADELDAEEVSLSDRDVVEDITGCVVGSVPPFGPCLGVPSYVDKSVLDKEVVHASVGTHTDSVEVSTDAFEELAFTVLSCSYMQDGS